MFNVLNFLKCVVTQVVWFLIVAFKTLDISQGSNILAVCWDYFLILTVK